jgi:hypothetical protein
VVTAAARVVRGATAIAVVRAVRGAMTTVAVIAVVMIVRAAMVRRAAAKATHSESKRPIHIVSRTLFSFGQLTIAILFRFGTISAVTQLVAHRKQSYPCRTKHCAVTAVPHFFGER